MGWCPLAALRVPSLHTTPALEIEPLFHQKLSPGSGSVAPITLLRALSVEFDRSGGLVLRSIPRDDVPRTTTILTDGIGPMHESFAGGSEGLLLRVVRNMKPFRNLRESCWSRPLQ